jgi:hypothetical protein
VASGKPHVTNISIKRYPVLTFYALVFAISWGGMNGVKSVELVRID